MVRWSYEPTLVVRQHSVQNFIKEQFQKYNCRWHLPKQSSPSNGTRCYILWRTDSSRFPFGTKLISSCLCVTTLLHASLCSALCRRARSHACGSPCTSWHFYCDVVLCEICSKGDMWHVLCLLYVMCYLWLWHCLWNCIIPYRLK